MGKQIIWNVKKMYERHILIHRKTLKRIERHSQMIIKYDNLVAFFKQLIMQGETYPNFKQFLLLVLLYFTLQIIFALIVTMPKAFEWQLLEQYSVFLRIAKGPFIYLPLIIYLSHISKIPGTWSMNLPSLLLVLLMVIMAMSVRILIQPLIVPMDLIGGKIKLVHFDVPPFNLHLVMRIIFIGFIGPILEEILWRKQIFGLLLKKYTPVVAIVLSSALFALAHHQVAVLGFVFIWGLLFSFVYYITKSLELSILLHSIINLSGFFIKNEFVDFNDMRVVKHILLIAICAILLYGAIRHLLQNRLENKDGGVGDPALS